MKTELLDKTSNNMIFIERDEPHSRQKVEEILEDLTASVEKYENGDRNAVKDAISKAVPTYREADVVNRKAEQSEEMKMVK